MDWLNKKVLVTGGGSGIGREIVKQLYAKGAYVIVASLLQSELMSLNEELSTRTGKIDNLLLLQIDLTEDGAVERLVSMLEQKKLVLDIVINNAGTGLFGEFIDQDAALTRKILTLNIQVVTELSGAVAKQMVQHDVKGHIVNIASVAAYTPIPKMATYAASKHFVLSFTRALSIELQPYGIHVLAFCPGITRTPIYEVMGLQTGQNSKGSISYLGDKLSMSADKVAVSVIKSIEKNKRVTLPSFNKLVVLSEFIPAQLKAYFMHKVMTGRTAK